MFYRDIEFGDPVDDMVSATILLLVGGKLVLLRPRRVRLYFRPCLCNSH